LISVGYVRNEVDTDIDNHYQLGDDRSVMSRSLRLISLALCCAPLLLAEAANAEGTYWSTKALLKSFFADSERVSYVEVAGSELAELTGRRAARARYVVFVATSGGKVDGYAVIDEEKGQHQPITFGTQLDASGRVVRTEVMVYREGYGDEIREGRFRKQYRGKGASDSLRFGQDVVAISGATISSRSMTVAVARAVKLVQLARGKPPPARSASLPSRSAG
jgi:Na+-translocating ferredoxin:NAD+ oxidoreductase RnfG subunit